LKGKPWYISHESRSPLKALRHAQTKARRCRGISGVAPAEKQRAQPLAAQSRRSTLAVTRPTSRQTGFAPELNLKRWQLTIQRLQQINRLPRAAILISRRMMCPNRRPTNRRKSPSTKTKAVMATLATTTSRAPKELPHRIRFSNHPLIALMWCMASFSELRK
jgi:hypothetical protein